MPVSPEAQLISSVIVNSELRKAISAGITPDMFHHCHDEWQWLVDYWTRHRKQPSRVAFKARFDTFRLLKVDDTDHFIDEVRRSHTRTTMIGVVNTVADALADGDVDLAMKLMGTSMVQAYATLGTGNDTDIFSDYKDILFDVEARVQRVQETGLSGIPTGFSKVDEETGGHNPGELTIVGARLGHGKSWVLQSWAAHAAAKNYIVLFDALEQTRAQVGMRLHGLLSSSVGEKIFRTTSLMRGRDFDLRAYKAFLRDLKKTFTGRLHVSDTSRGLVSPMTIAGQIERWSPDIVFVDYITLLKRSGNEWFNVAELPGELKSIAGRYHIPIVAAAQLNRADGISRGNEPPGVESLSQSDAIGQDADAVYTMKQLSPSVTVMKAAKMRNGAGGWLSYLEFRPGDGIIKDISYQRAQILMDKDADAADAEKDKRK